jgi:hypothetical protein
MTGATLNETESNAPSQQSPAPRTLDPRELELLADKIIERMKRELKLEREREGKPR